MHVGLTLHSGGELSGLHLEKSSGVAKVDQAALHAIEDAAPFSPLPPGSAERISVIVELLYRVTR